MVIDDIDVQDQVADALLKLFPSAVVIDRRKAPSHGYRAVHVVVSDENKLVEVQVRTDLQHRWAELSEKFSDKVDPAIKYGGGDRQIRSILLNASTMVAKMESIDPHPPFSELVSGVLDSFDKLVLILEETKRNNQ